MKNNLLSEKLIYTGDSLAPTHLHLCTYSTTEIQESSGNTFQSIKDTLDNTHINWLQVHGMKDTETIREICSHFENRLPCITGYSKCKPPHQNRRSMINILS